MINQDMFGKEVEVRKPFPIHYSVYYFAPFSGGNIIVAEAGTRFRIKGAWGEDAYDCDAVDRAFEKAAEKAELKSVTPYVRSKFGKIEGFRIPISALDDGTVGIVEPPPADVSSPNESEEVSTDEEDEESDEEFAEEEEEESEEESGDERAFGYPEGYAVGVAHGAYCVIDLASSPRSEHGNGASQNDGGKIKYSVSYMDEPPEGGWTEEYKTTKIVLKLVKGGAFTMGTDTDADIREVNPPHNVELPNDFYIGVFPVTQRQYELVTGCNPSANDADGSAATCPVENVCYNTIRGSVRGFNWPEYSDVDEDSFLGILRARSGITNIDIPTAAQWEYACKAGETDASAAETGNGEVRFWFDGNGNGTTHPVGLLKPNAWGLYDMLGNVWEWCLDWYGDYCEEGPVQSPSGIIPAFPRLTTPISFMFTPRKAREIKGGGWNTPGYACNASSRGLSGASRAYGFVGFRLSITLEL